MQGGRHVIPQPEEKYTSEELQLMKTQDVKYVQMKLSTEKKVSVNLVSFPDPPNAPREKGSGQKGRTSVSPRSKSCGTNQIAEAESHDIIGPLANSFEHCTLLDYLLYTSM